MCRCFVCDLDWDAIGHQFDTEDRTGDVLPPASYRLQPPGPVGIIAQTPDGLRHMRAAKWSLLPRWSKQAVLPYPTYNARIESASVKPTFADCMRSSRSIIPTNGYYEWRGIRPFYFHIPERRFLAMAGLYSWWRAPGQERWKLTATILTMQAVGEAARVHHRMPVLLPRRLWDQWLDPSVDGGPMVEPVRRSATKFSEELEMFEVSSPDDPHTTDGPKLIEPMDRGGQQPLFL